MPDGGFPEAIKAFEKAVEITAKGPAEIMPMLSDDFQYVTMTAQVLDKPQIPAFLDVLYATGIDSVKPVEPIRTLDRFSAWTLIMAHLKDGTVLPADIGPFHPYFHYVKIGPDGKYVRIAQVLNSVDSYTNTAKLIKYGMEKAQEAAKVGTGA